MSAPRTAAGRALVRWLTTGNNPPRSAEHIALAIEAEARAAALDEARAAVEGNRELGLTHILAALDALRDVKWSSVDGGHTSAAIDALREDADKP